MTKTQAAQKAQAYADSLPTTYRVCIVKLQTRYIVRAHQGAHSIKRTFKFDNIETAALGANKFTTTQTISPISRAAMLLVPQTSMRTFKFDNTGD